MFSVERSDSNFRRVDVEGQGADCWACQQNGTTCGAAPKSRCKKSENKEKELGERGEQVGAGQCSVLNAPLHRGGGGKAPRALVAPMSGWGESSEDERARRFDLTTDSFSVQD